MSLLLRLYDPVAGQILFDEKYSQFISLSVLRQQMAIVPQDIFLFGGTIRENIAYGKTGSSEEMIANAARKANAVDCVAQTYLLSRRLFGTPSLSGLAQELHRRNLRALYRQILQEEQTTPTASAGQEIKAEE